MSYIYQNGKKAMFLVNTFPMTMHNLLVQFKTVSKGTLQDISNVIFVFCSLVYTDSFQFDCETSNFAYVNPFHDLNQFLNQPVLSEEGSVS